MLPPLFRLVERGASLAAAASGAYRGGRPSPAPVGTEYAFRYHHQPQHPRPSRPPPDGHWWRSVAVVKAVIIVLLVAPASAAALGFAVLSHVAGMFVERWLFFAEAKHVVTLYYEGAA